MPRPVLVPGLGLFSCLTCEARIVHEGGVVAVEPDRCLRGVEVRWRDEPIESGVVSFYSTTGVVQIHVMELTQQHAIVDIGAAAVLPVIGVMRLAQ